MIYPAGFLLIALNDTPENLVKIKSFISQKNLTNEDVKLTRRVLLELRTRRELKYG